MRFASCALALVLVTNVSAFAADDGIPLNRSQYANRPVLPDFTAPACPDNPRGLEQIKGNLYRHTTGPGLAVHSGLVLVTSEGALVIDPAMTCTAPWLRDEIKRRFNVTVAYVVYTHGHADHVSGARVFQNEGSVVGGELTCGGTHHWREDPNGSAGSGVRQEHDHNVGRGNRAPAPYRAQSFQQHDYGAVCGIQGVGTDLCV